MQLEGASVLLTGASRGIGAALARALGARGARLALVARSAEGLAAVQRDLAGSVTVAGDVADPATAKRAVEAARSEFGRIDLLLNNAAILTEPRPLVKTPHEDWRAVLEVNVLGTVAFLRETLPVMAAQRSGVCVNLSSGWGRSADADVAPYVASKWAVEGLTRSVALEVPKGVAVLAVNPGIIDTEMLRVAFGERASRTYPGPEELAPRFLAMLERVDASWNGRSVDAWEGQPG